eukprot:12107302-Alexandrium_andersonii.AAC.1
MEDVDLLTKAAMEQAQVACLATPQQPRRASSQQAAAPRIGSSVALPASSSAWQAQRIRAQERVIAELRARLQAKASPPPGSQSPPLPAASPPSPPAAPVATTSVWTEDLEE